MLHDHCVCGVTDLHRLRFLDASAITARFSDFLTEREMRDLLHRRNNVLLYLDRLVENKVCGGWFFPIACLVHTPNTSPTEIAQGYSETVIECSSLESTATVYTNA